MLNISKLTKYFGKDKALNNLSLKIKKGEVVGFLGPNGAGKSTTLKTIVGLIRPTSGQVKIGGLDSGDIQSRRLFGYLPENPQFYDYLTGREFIIFINELAGIDKKKVGDEANRLLKLVDLTAQANKPVGYYSKGMRQRLGLAAALVAEPPVLLLDEPLDGLDPIGRNEMKKILLDLKKAGKTILISSHILTDIEEICDRVVIINRGQIIVDKTLTDFLKNRKNLEKQFVDTIEKDQL